jgi:ribonuclease P protein component
MPAPTVGRITSRAAFAEVQRSRARGASGPVRAVFVPAAADAPGLFPQVGYAIGRRCGPAVVRNRLRRRARAVVREEASTLPRGAFMVRLDPGAASQTAAEFRHDLARALHRAGAKAATRA